MKMIAAVSLDKPGSMAMSSFKRLLLLSPSAKLVGCDDCIQATYEVGDPELIQLVRGAQKAGLKLQKWASARTYHIHVLVEDATYDEHDLAKFKYLEARPRHDIEKCVSMKEDTYSPKSRVTPETLTKLEAQTREKLLTGDLPVARLGVEVIVTEKFKAAWDKSGMKGVKFIKPFALKCPAKAPVQYFLVWPDIWLADGDGLSKSMQTDVEALLARHKVDEDIGSLLLNKRPVREVISKQSVAHNEPFDLATTDYRLPAPGFLVASHRFRKFCQEFGAEFIWEPVEVEE